MENQVQTANNAERAEFEQAADALAAICMKADKQPAPVKDLGKIVPFPTSKEPTGDPQQCEEPSKSQEPEKSVCDEGPQFLGQMNCSSCMKLIPNPIADGHGIVDGHVGQFRMLIPWTQKEGGSGVLCSRCYQRNWRLNKQRLGSADKSLSEGIPREPYKCLCGMTFQSSQLKAAHCRLCQKYRELADQEQRHEGNTTTTSTTTTPKSSFKEGAAKRPRSASDNQSHRSPPPRSAERKEQDDGLFSPTPPPAKRISIHTPPLIGSGIVSSFDKVNTTPVTKPSTESGGVNSLGYQKIQLAQLLHTTRLLGQVDVVQYATLTDLVNTTTDPTLFAEITQLILQFALKPLVYPSQFIGTPASSRISRFDEGGESKQFKTISLLPSMFKFPAELDTRTYQHAIK